MNSHAEDIKALFQATVWYSKRKIAYFAARFESIKNISVEVMMRRRGALQKSIFHTSMLGLFSVGVLTSGVFGGGSIVSSTYPGIGGPDPRFIQAFEPYPSGLILDEIQDPHTDVSVKPRSEVEEYKVESGHTLSSIAKKYGLSADTIKWANNLTDIHSLSPGQTLKILPVSGLSHKVQSGDTLESIAKKYSAESQAILDFPFNDIPDDFALKVGQVLMVPDGQPPEVPVKIKPRPKYLSQGPSSPAFEAPFGGNFVWPTDGGISQYFAWYHPGIDIPNKSAPGIAASDGGIAVVAGWPDGQGYGNRVVIDHQNGYQSLYAHLSNVYVSAGQNVTRGQIIGQMGSTGRSTGTHLHFEIHYKGVPINPLAILK